MRGGVTNREESAEFVVVVGRDETASLVERAATAGMHVSRVGETDAVPRRADGEPVDVLVVDGATEWRSVVADRAVPTVVLATETTPVPAALDAGATDCVRLSDPAAESMLAARLERAVETTRDRADRERRREWLETVVRHSTDSMSVVAPDGTARYNSPAVADQLGYDPSELRGQNLLTQIHPDDAPAVRERFTELVEQPDGTYETATYRRRHADGSWRWMETVANVQLDNPRIGGVVVNRRDVTERERRRQRLREQEAYVESLLDAQPDVFYTLDADGFFTEWNARLTDALGYDDAELASMHAVEVVVPEDREEIMEAMTTVYQDGGTQQRETALLTADGDPIPYQLNGAPLTDSDGEVTGLVGTGRNISGRVRREERLAVLNRVLRHNLRNRTNVVIGHARRLADTLDDETAVEHAETIRGVGLDLDRLGVLARKVDRALDGQVEPVAMEPARVVSDALADLDGVEPVVGDPPDVRITALGSLADALAELLDNAVRHNPAADPTVRVTFDVTADELIVAIADDGPQIPDHEVAALEEGESRLRHGGGLGLWFVNWVVDASGGALAFEESESGGNRVAVRLPRADE